MKTYSLTFSLLFICLFASAQQDSAYHPSSLQQDSMRSEFPPRQTTNLVLKSTDGGQTWKDISKGLPENWVGDNCFANEFGLFVGTGNRVFHSKPNSTAPFWANETFPNDNTSIAPGNAGMFAYSSNGQISQKKNGTNKWSPQFSNFKVNEIRSVFETAKGTLFICTDHRVYRSTNSGKDWNEVHNGGWVIKMAESNGVLMATSQWGILHSADDGENWKTVLSEGGVGIDIQPIKGGFAAINYNTLLNARTIKATYDGGKTWQSIDAGLPPHLNTASIVQVGDDFLCGHPSGIFKSSDKGITWKLIVPSPKEKVYRLFISGNVIYAVATFEGC